MNPYDPPSEPPDIPSTPNRRAFWWDTRAFRWIQRIFLAWLFTGVFYPAAISDPIYRSLATVAIFIGLLIAFVFFYRSSSE